MTRPPKRSVQMPSGRRNSAPVRTGVAVRSPSWVESRWSRARIGMPVTPNIVHTAKQTVNAQVVTNRTLRFPDFGILTSNPSSKCQRANRAAMPAPAKTSLSLVLHVRSACVLSAEYRSPFLRITPCEFAMPSSRLSAMRRDNTMKRSAAACGQTSWAVCAKRASHRSKCWASIGSGRCRAMGSP